MDNQPNDRFEVSLRPELAEPQASPQQVMSRVALLAAAAALIGAIAWGLITFYSNTEIGTLAWAIDGLVGLAVAFAAKSQLERNHLVVSVIFGLAGIVGGKYLHYYLNINDLEKELGVSLDGVISFSDTFSSYDLLWIALAAITAWTLPTRMSNRF